MVAELRYMGLGIWVVMCGSRMRSWCMVKAIKVDNPSDRQHCGNNDGEEQDLMVILFVVISDIT